MYSSGLRVVIVNGKPGVGKTTFEKLARDILGEAFCESRSTVDKVKEIAAYIGWDGVKDLKSRKLLSDLKDITTEYNDMPIKDIIKYLDKWDGELRYYGVGDQPHVFFIDDREPEHIQRLKEKLNAITVLIRRPGDEDIETSNHADEKVFEYNYDWTIYNDGDVEDFKNKTQAFLDWIFS